MSSNEKTTENSDVKTVEMAWLKGTYHFHTYAYRDPRSAFASGIGLPVVSPTTVLLGMVSSLFSTGDSGGAQRLLDRAHECEVLVDAPDGVIFFRAFHQLRRYNTEYEGKDKRKGINARYGLTTINQGTREYGLVDGAITVYVGVPSELSGNSISALTNLRHLGTSDSLCSLIQPVSVGDRPDTMKLLYAPRRDFAKRILEQGLGTIGDSVTTVTLSTFNGAKPLKQTLRHWKMAGDSADTELTPYVIAGSFEGTTRGRIYRKGRPR